MTTEQDILDMSDEEFDKLPLPGDEEIISEDEAPEEPSTDDSSSEESVNRDETEEELPNEEAETEEDVQSEDRTEAEEEESESTTEEAEGAEEFNYKEAYEDIIKPFQANGSEFSVKDVDEVRRLMQMGVGFSKKNKEYKEFKTIAKTLEANDISGERLNFAIDLLNGNQEAISKLLKEKDIDPLDIEDENSEYTPSNHQIPSNQVELEEVLESFQESENFDNTVKLFTDGWDQASIQKANEDPSILATINDHMNNGVFGKVQQEVDRARMFGRLPERISDIDAYQMVGAQLDKEGFFDEDETQSNSQTEQTIQSKVRPSNNKQRKAASIPNNSTETESQEKDPFEMSDEEFNKKYGSL